MSASIIDAHVAMPSAGITGPGQLLAIMGTSTCDILLSKEERMVPGMCGVVDGGVYPGYYAYDRRASPAWATISPGLWTAAALPLIKRKPNRRGKICTFTSLSWLKRCSPVKAASLPWIGGTATAAC